MVFSRTIMIFLNNFSDDNILIKVINQCTKYKILSIFELFNMNRVTVD